jgi:hypothetical protein
VTLRDLEESHGGGARQAQLLLAMLLLAVAPMLLLDRPIETHQLIVDLPHLPDSALRAGQALAPYREPLADRLAAPAGPGGWHLLVPMPDHTIVLDGEALDLPELHHRLEQLARLGAWIELRPHREARYELVHEVLAITPACEDRAPAHRFQRLPQGNR